MKTLSRMSLLIAFGIVLEAGSAVAQNPSYQPMPGVGVNYENRLASVEDQMRALTGKVEQLEYTLNRLDTTLQRMQSDSDARLSKLEAAAVAPPMAQTQAPVPQQAYAPLPPPSPNAQSGGAGVMTGNAPPTVVDNGGAPAQERSSLRGTLGAIKVQGDKVVGAVKQPKSPPLPPTPPDYGLSPQEQYDKAFGLLRQADYEGAERAFKAFIDKNPKDKMIDNAKYWYAQTFYARSRFSDSAMAFADAYQQNVKGTKAPDSLLQLALSLAALEKTSDACTTLVALKKDYPASPVTIRAHADQLRAQLKCGSKAAPAAQKAPPPAADSEE